MSELGKSGRAARKYKDWLIQLRRWLLFGLKANVSKRRIYPFLVGSIVCLLQAATAQDLSELIIADFLKHPPPYQTFTYDKEIHVGGEVFQNRIQGAVRNDGACWASVDGMEFRGKVDGLFWLYSTKGKMLQEYDRALNSKAQTEFTSSAAVSEWDAGFMKSLGFTEIMFSDAKWRGSAFETVAVIDMQGTEIPVYGAIEKESSWEYSIRITNGANGKLHGISRLIYSSPSNHGNPFPKRMVISHYDEHGQAAEMVLKILQVGFEADAPSDFVLYPTNVPGVRPTGIVFYENDALYSMAQGVKSRVVTSEDEPGGSNTGKRWGVLMAMVVVAMLAIVFLSRQFARGSKNK